MLVDNSSALSLTVADNMAESGGGVWNRNGSSVLQNCLFQGNTATNGPDALGITSQGYNLFSRTGDLSDLLSSDVKDLDGRIGPLQDNGGPTWTHALMANSPAIDHGDAGTNRVDQRGLPRAMDYVGIPNTSNGDDLAIDRARWHDVVGSTSGLRGTSGVSRYTARRLASSGAARFRCRNRDGRAAIRHGREIARIRAQTVSSPLDASQRHTFTSEVGAQNVGSHVRLKWRPSYSSRRCYGRRPLQSRNLVHGPSLVTLMLLLLGALNARHVAGPGRPNSGDGKR